MECRERGIKGHKNVCQLSERQKKKCFSSCYQKRPRLRFSLHLRLLQRGEAKCGFSLIIV